VSESLPPARAQGRHLVEICPEENPGPLPVKHHDPHGLSRRRPATRRERRIEHATKGVPAGGPVEREQANTAAVINDNPPARRCRPFQALGTQRSEEVLNRGAAAAVRRFKSMPSLSRCSPF